MTTYWQGPAGAFFEIPEGVDPPTDGSVEITESEYGDGVAAMLAALESAEHAALLEELALRRRVYVDLRDNAGLADETSRFLSGYYGEDG